MTLSEQGFLLTTPAAAQELRDRLEVDTTVRSAGREQLVRTYLDTFDWEVFRSGAELTAERRRDRLELRLTTAQEVASCRLDGPSLPAFLGEVPDGRVREALSTAVTVRRLLPVAETRIDAESLAILDGRRKTIVRVVFESRTAVAGGGEPEVPIVARLRVLPVKGYESDSDSVLRALAGISGVEPDDRGELAVLLALRGRRPGDYSSKLDIALEPSAPARLAVREILRTLFAIMRANEDGMRRALDPEFLHDFRVSVRRTRTALGQLRRILPQASVDRFRRDFSWLGAATGPCRDLDVYLLKMGDYRRLLPPSVGRELAPLENYLRERLEIERAQLVQTLETERYESLLVAWQVFLDGEDGLHDDDSRADWPVRQVATADIRRAWRRALKRGGRIDDSSPGETLHRLRIDCKKLRYLLEFFRRLAPAEEVAAAIGALKKLQDNLGDFNDYVVQQEMLGRLAMEMSARRAAPPATLMALGRLTARLEDGERDERRKFRKRFRAFASEDALRVFERLLVDIGREATG
jgi:CHAD domain-containing protein